MLTKSKGSQCGGVPGASHITTAPQDEGSEGPGSKGEDAQIVQKSQAWSIILLFNKDWWSQEVFFGMISCDSGDMH